MKRFVVLAVAGLALAGVAFAADPNGGIVPDQGEKQAMGWLLSVFVGVSLSAACGFRVFVPLLIMSIASRAGQLELAPNFEWIGSWEALAAFAVATVCEIGGYFVPLLDNALDAIATPAALVAGAITTGSMVHDVSPLLQWSLAIVAGGGAAGIVQAGTASARLALAPAPPANAVVATGEAAGSTVTSLVAVYLPVIGVVLGLLIVAGFILLFLRFRSAAAKPPALA